MFSNNMGLHALSELHSLRHFSENACDKRYAALGISPLWCHRRHRLLALLSALPNKKAAKGPPHNNGLNACVTPRPLCADCYYHNTSWTTFSRSSWQTHAHTRRHARRNKSSLIHRVPPVVYVWKNNSSCVAWRDVIQLSWPTYWTMQRAGPQLCKAPKGNFSVVMLKHTHTKRQLNRQMWCWFQHIYLKTAAEYVAPLTKDKQRKSKYYNN